MEILPIGTTLIYNDIPLLICGYTLNENETITPCYKVIVSPIGYINSDSIRNISVFEDFEIIKKGYTNPLFAEFSKYKSAEFEALNGAGEKDFEEIITSWEKYEQ